MPSGEVLSLINKSKADMSKNNIKPLFLNTIELVKLESEALSFYASSIVVDNMESSFEELFGKDSSLNDGAGFYLKYLDILTSLIDGRYLYDKTNRLNAEIVKSIENPLFTLVI